MENTTLEKRAQLSEIIQRSRIQKGLSQEKLAEKVGCVRSTIDRLEKTKFSIKKGESRREKGGVRRGVGMW